MDEFDLGKCRYDKIILMTDADVDGAHIRTLLLTFLFRQMPALFDNKKVYIAQPPLYEIKIKGRKKAEYLLSEAAMHKRLIGRGLEGTALVIREGGSSRRVEGKRLSALVKDLADIERMVEVLSRRGIDFEQFVRSYYNGTELPRFLLRIGMEEEVYYDKAEHERRVEELEQGQSGEGQAGQDRFTSQELHEVSTINRLNDALKADFGLDLSHFLLKQEKADSGESLPTMFKLNNEQDTYEIASLGEICSRIRQIGSKGVDVKRFKGLGEMNADQLWETTMNPATRVLLSVRLDDAGEADRLFSILMGDDVEKRRMFIQEHALEVQNLDV
jgi:DNA gyrase subunit B